jgi:hypothetical protein
VAQNDAVAVTVDGAKLGEAVGSGGTPVHCAGLRCVKSVVDVPRLFHTMVPGPYISVLSALRHILRPQIWKHPELSLLLG